MAYKLQSELESIDLVNNTVCSFCKGNNNIITDSVTGEKVCTGCGVVYEALLSDLEVKSSTIGNGSNGGILQNFLLSTTIENKNIDYSGNAIPVEQTHTLNRIRKIDRFAGNDGNFERNLKDAAYIIGVLRDNLSLSDTIIDLAFNKYIKTVKAKIIKGRSIKGFVAASVYSACRDANVPRSLYEIADAVDADRSLTRRCYNLLVEKLDIDSNNNKVESNVYLSRAANMCGLSNRTLLKAIEIWAKVKDNPVLSGKKPAALAMAMLYHASTLTGEHISKTKMAETCSMSKVTLNKRVEEIERLCNNS